MRIPHRSKISTTIFRKAKNGTVYYLPSTAGPFVKIATGIRLANNQEPQENPSVQAPVSPTQSIRVVERFLRIWEFS